MMVADEFYDGRAWVDLSKVFWRLYAEDERLGFLRHDIPGAEDG